MLKYVELLRLTKIHKLREKHVHLQRNDKCTNSVNEEQIKSVKEAKWNYGLTCVTLVTKHCRLNFGLAPNDKYYADFEVSWRQGNACLKRTVNGQVWTGHFCLCEDDKHSILECLLVLQDMSQLVCHAQVACNLWWRPIAFVYWEAWETSGTKFPIFR